MSDDGEDEFKRSVYQITNVCLNGMMFSGESGKLFDLRVSSEETHKFDPDYCSKEELAEMRNQSKRLR